MHVNAQWLWDLHLRSSVIASSIHYLKLFPYRGL